jgi:hypothetical protein
MEHEVERHQMVMRVLPRITLMVEVKNADQYQ